MGSTLGSEIRVFERNRAQWVADGQTGQWAVIRGEQVLGLFGTLETAYQAGLDAFGAVNFLVKKVTSKDEVQIVHRVRYKPA